MASLGLAKRWNGTSTTSLLDILTLSPFPAEKAFLMRALYASTLCVPVVAAQAPRTSSGDEQRLDSIVKQQKGIRRHSPCPATLAQNSTAYTGSTEELAYLAAWWCTCMSDRTWTMSGRRTN